MEAREIIYAELAKVEAVSGRVYAVAAPQNATLPYIIYRVKEFKNSYTKDAPAECDATMEVRAVAASQEEALSVISEAITKIQSNTSGCFLRITGGLEEYDAEKFNQLLTIKVLTTWQM
ncbi:MAG: hypothetical protein PUB21_00760 [Bacteroidales bacterium]|nr:hypothetical protein [Bacteroidales bacterium]